MTNIKVTRYVRTIGLGKAYTPEAEFELNPDHYQVAEVLIDVMTRNGNDMGARFAGMEDWELDGVREWLDGANDRNELEDLHISHGADGYTDVKVRES